MNSDNAEAIVQANLEAYNARDIDRFMRSFSAHIIMRDQLSGEIFAQGLDAVRDLYQALFEKSPQLHSKIKARMVLGNSVIDHEQITGRLGSPEMLELILIYEVADGKIQRVSTVRAQPAASNSAPRPGG